MIFIDPDGNGRNCIDMHINALDNVDDVWLKEGSTSREKQVLNLKKTTIWSGTAPVVGAGYEIREGAGS
jgi:hypothetical protein